MQVKARKPEESEVILSKIIFHKHANPYGFAHGGEIVKIMDNAAGACSMKHASGMVVTRSINEVDFHRSVKVGSILSVKANVVYVSNHTMQIFVQAFAEDLRDKNTYSCATAYFTYISLDENSVPQKVPELILTTEKDKAAFAAGKKRMENFKRFSEINKQR